VVGEEDLTDIALLVPHGKGLSVEKIGKGKELASFDEIFIADMDNPQAVYDNLKTRVKLNRLLYLDLFHISRRCD